MDSAGASSEPSCKRTKDQGDCSEQSSARHDLGCRGGCLRSLLSGLLRGLAILLFILPDAVSGLLDRDVLRARKSLGGTLTCVLRLSLIASHGSAYGRYGCIPQGRRIVAAAGVAHLLFNSREWITDP